MANALDKIKTAALAIGVGASTSACAALLALAVLARLASTSLGTAIGYVTTYPIAAWPASLLLWALAVPILAGATVVVVLWLTLANLRWAFRARRIDGPEAAAALIARAATIGTRIFAGRFEGKPMHVSVEDRGLVIGPPGTGKTAFLFNQILRATELRLSFVVVDFKPEIYKTLAASLEKAGYRVLRINPASIDETMDHWNPLADINDETQLTELCAALLPIRDPREAPFVDAQRDWLKAAVFHVSVSPGGSIPAAFNLLSAHADALKLLDIIGRSPSPTAARLARRIAAGLAGGKPDPLILQGLTGALRSLDYLSLPGVQKALGHSDFSARELGQGERPTALFLQFEESKINALGPLLAFMATSVLTTLIDTAGQRAPVALFLDELGNMPPIPNLPQKLNTIRSRDIPTWMFFQTAEQIDMGYGRGAISTFFASSDFQMVFRLNDQSTRDLISKLIGTTHKEKFSHSKNGQQGSTTRSRENGNVIEPHELGQLAPSEVIVMYRGAAAKGKATPHFVDYPEFKRKTK